MGTSLGAIILSTIPAYLLFHAPIIPFEEKIMLKHFEFFTQCQVLFLGLCPPVSVSIFSTETIGPQQNGAPCFLMNWSLPFSYCFQTGYSDTGEMWGKCVPPLTFDSLETRLLPLSNSSPHLHVSFPRRILI